MAKIKNKNDLMAFCLRQLGDPVIDINVSEDQVTDAIDNAYEFWAEYHYLATERSYVVIEIDETDIQNRYFKLPDSVVEVVNVYADSGISGLKGMSDPIYRMRMQDLMTGSGFYSGGNNLINYFVHKSYFSMLEDNLNSDITFEFSRYTNKLAPRLNWGNEVRPGQKILAEVVKRTDPEENPEIWNDWVLRKLATEYLRRQWGYNLSKMQDIQLPGGGRLNGQGILDEANRNIEAIETDFIYKFSAPLGITIG